MARHWIATEFGDLDVLRLVEYEPPQPGPGEVTIAVLAAGVNPADFKHIRSGARESLPIPIGYEIAGVVTAVGLETHLSLGQEVLAFRVKGGYATEITVPAADVFVRPPRLSFPEAANLLLAGTTAAEMLHVTRVSKGDTILVHGASGAVGVSVLQQARRIGARAIGTASRANFEVVERFGGIPVEYGNGLEERVRAFAPNAALDCVGTDEAIAVSLALVADRSRIVTIVVGERARKEGFKHIGGAMPESKKFRDGVRAELVALAGNGDLVVPVARTFPLDEAIEALKFVRTGHPGGKVALLP